MTRRTIITILIAVLAAVVVGMLWLWLFGSSGPAPAQTGTFGTGTTRTTTPASTNTTPTNIPGSVGQTAGRGGAGSSVTITIPGSGIGAAGAASTTAAPTGVNWLAGGGSGGGSGTTFIPAAINQLNNGQVGGSVSVLGSFSSPSSNNSGSNSGLLGAGLAVAGTAAACSLLPFITSGGLPTAAAADGVISGAIGSPGVYPTLDIGVRTQLAALAPWIKANTAANASQAVKSTFFDCLARTIAKAALQQITASVVNWINSGFNGQPSFVTNYQQLFANVADQAAGEFIKTQTNFAPFCTPFRTQIQIALAQSYARRNTAPACSLSTLLGTDVTKFMRGDFSSAGWGGLLQFTTVQANNPYGAYMSAQVQLQGALAQAAQKANQNISPGGFLNFQEAYDCQASVPAQGQTNGAGGAVVNGAILGQQYGQQCPSNCKCRTTTPGSVIQTSLSDQLNVPNNILTQAGVSGSFDAIINALLTQLTTRALQGGVSNLSGTTGYASYYLTPDQQAAQTQGQTLLTNLQGFVTLAQQFGGTEDGSAHDIEQAQEQITPLVDCWQAAASSTEDVQKQNIAASNAASAQNTLHSFDAQIASLNAQITRANAAIAMLQDLQTQTLNVGSTADVAAIQASLDAANAQGALIAQADVTQAQQDRTSLQTRLTSLAQSISGQLNQCYAFH